MEIKDKNTELDVKNAKLVNSKFSNADLSGAQFKDVGLKKVRLSDVNLEAASISNSNLTSLKIENCNLSEMSIDGVLVADLFKAWKADHSQAPIKTSKKTKDHFSPEEYLPFLEAVTKQLESKSWFKKEGWLSRVSLFTKVPPAVASMHIYKDHWFNKNGQGIHFETFIGPKEEKMGSVNVVLHLLHTPTIPGTKEKRIELSKLVIDKAYKMINEWPGYKFRAGKYGVQPFSKVVEFDDENLSTQLTTEFARLCRNLGPVIDSSLEKIQNQ